MSLLELWKQILKQILEISCLRAAGVRVAFQDLRVTNTGSRAVLDSFRPARGNFASFRDWTNEIKEQIECKTLISAN